MAATSLGDGKLFYLGPEAVFRAAVGPTEWAVARCIAGLPTVCAPVGVVPEARNDKPGTLSGLVFRTEGPDAHVYPGLVPDAGCGYHLALVKNFPWSSVAPQELAAILTDAAGVYSPNRRRRVETLRIDGLLSGAVAALDRIDGDNLSSAETPTSCGGLDPAVLSEDILLMARETLGCFLGHFLELRQVSEIFDRQLACELNLDVGDGVMVVHAGSQRLHRVLQNELHVRFGQCHHPLYGASIAALEGATRLAATFAAQRFARASRSLAVRLLLESLHKALDLPTESTFSLSDVYHSRIRVNPSNGLVEHLRGVQLAHDPTNVAQARRQVLLLAGTKSTSSYLVVPHGSRREGVDDMLCHGTPERLYEELPASALERFPVCRELTPPAYADTPIDFADAPRCACCTEMLLEHFLKQDIIRAVCRLKPYINIQKADTCPQMTRN